MSSLIEKINREIATIGEEIRLLAKMLRRIGLRKLHLRKTESQMAALLKMMQQLIIGANRPGRLFVLKSIDGFKLKIKICR